MSALVFTKPSLVRDFDDQLNGLSGEAFELGAAVKLNTLGVLVNAANTTGLGPTFLALTKVTGAGQPVDYIRDGAVGVGVAVPHHIWIDCRVHRLHLAARSCITDPGFNSHVRQSHHCSAAGMAVGRRDHQRARAGGGFADIVCRVPDQPRDQPIRATEVRNRGIRGCIT